jgi:putative lipoic acid-binding regulatory protein
MASLVLLVIQAHTSQDSYCVLVLSHSERGEKYIEISVHVHLTSRNYMEEELKKLPDERY